MTETTTTPDGVALIAAERRRQIEARGYTAEHDDQHRCGELGSAAAFYAAGPGVTTDVGSALMALWPQEWGNPTTFEPGGFTLDGRIRELAVAGALVAAEIDRLQRRLARSAAKASGGGA